MFDPQIRLSPVIILVNNNFLFFKTTPLSTDSFQGQKFLWPNFTFNFSLLVQSTVEILKWRATRR